MVGIIKFFGVLSIIGGVILIVISFGTIVFLPTLLPLGASALLGGVLLIAFARVVELLEELNSKLTPIQSIAIALEKSIIQTNQKWLQKQMVSHGRYPGFPRVLALNATLAAGSLSCLTAR